MNLQQVTRLELIDYDSPNEILNRPPDCKEMDALDRVIHEIRYDIAADAFAKISDNRDIGNKLVPKKSIRIENPPSSDDYVARIAIYPKGKSKIYTLGEPVSLDRYDSYDLTINYAVPSLKRFSSGRHELFSAVMRHAFFHEQSHALSPIQVRDCKIERVGYSDGPSSIRGNAFNEGVNELASKHAFRKYQELLSEPSAILAPAYQSEVTFIKRIAEHIARELNMTTEDVLQRIFKQYYALESNSYDIDEDIVHGIDPRKLKGIFPVGFFKRLRETNYIRPNANFNNFDQMTISFIIIGILQGRVRLK